MRYFIPAVAVLAFGVAPLAHAQVAGPGPGVNGGAMNGAPGPAPPPRAVTPDIAPAAIPGAAGIGTLQTSQKVNRAHTGDPTTDLFTAINAGDYAGAQDAVSRGADLTAQNPLGETPLDLSIALNHNNITFMILSVRNESGGAPPPGEASAAMPVAGTGIHKSKLHAVPVKDMAPVQARVVPTHNYAASADTPNVSVGSRGFENK